MKLKQQLWEKFIKEIEKEKEKLEMKKIEEKYRSELLSEVRKDMGRVGTRTNARKILRAPSFHGWAIT